MTCEECQGQFSDFFDKELAAGERAGVESHIASCDSCRAEFDTYSTGIRSLQESSSLEASGRFATDLMTSLRMEAVSPSPSEPPSVRRGLVGGAIAAAVTLAFIGGLFMRPDPREVVRKTEIEVPARGEDWDTIPREMERAVINKYDLVHYRGYWIPREMSDGFSRGKVCVAGQMLDREIALKKLKGGASGKELSLEERLKKLGYEKTAQGFIPRKWLARWQRGDVQVAPGKWQTADEFRRSHASGEPVGRPDDAIVENEVTRWIDGLRIGPAVSHRNMTLYPILRTRGGEPVEWDALRHNEKVKIEEVGNPFQIRVTNTSVRNLLLMEGEVLLGGKYARMVSADAQVPAGGEAMVSVLCVEPGANRKDSIFTGESGTLFASTHVRRVALEGGGQGAVWCELARHEPGKKNDLFSAFLDLPDRFAGTVGVAIAFGKSLEFVELFHDPRMFAQYFGAILTAAVQASSSHESSTGIDNSTEGVRTLLQMPYSSRIQPVGEGLLLKKGGFTLGMACPGGGDLVHLLLFANHPKGSFPSHEPPPVPEAKMESILDAIMEQITGGGEFSRILAIQSLALFHSPEAMVRLTSLLKNSDPVIRKFAVLCLSEKKDSSSVPSLVEYAGTLDRHFPEMERVLVALGSIGDPRALPLFLSWMEGEERRVRLVLKCLPPLMEKVEKREEWVQVMERVLSCFQDAEPETAATALETVHRMTGKEFSDGKGAQTWWGDESAREEYLRKRTGPR